MFDAYNIRKIAPRMLLAVIGVNLSIYLCVAAVDITNVIGGGLGALIRGPFIEAGDFGNLDIDPGSGAGEALATGSIVGLVGAGGASGLAAAGAAGSTGFMSAMLAGAVGLAGATAPFILIVLLLLILSGILIALAIMATVVIRYGAIILLTLVSPVAIAMLVLPGTERYFRKWWEYFQKTLIVYPIIAAIFAVSDVMAATFLKAQGVTGGIIQDFIVIFVTIVVVYAPLFMIPFSFKLAGGFLGSIYDMANKNMYGRAKPHMDKWKEDEKSGYGRAKARARAGREKAGFTGDQIGKSAMAASRVFGKGNRQGKSARDLLREARSAYGKETKRFSASQARLRAIAAEENDTDVKDIQGVDDVGKAIREIVGKDGNIEKAGKALRESNPPQYDYLATHDDQGVPLTEAQRAERKRNHDQVLNQVQALRGRYGDETLQIIGSRQDARASTGSDAIKMREDAIKAAGGVALDHDNRGYVTKWDNSNVDAISLARNLDDLRGFSKEAQRLDKAGIGFSGDITAVQRMMESSGTAAVDAIKEELLEGAIAKNSASTIATMHDKGIAEITGTLRKRIQKAKESGDDGLYQRRIAEAANLYDAFQYAAPKNMDKLSGLIEDKSVTASGKEVMREIETMRGDMKNYTEFAKYRRDWGQSEGEGRAHEGEGKIPPPTGPGS